MALRATKYEDAKQTTATKQQRRLQLGFLGIKTINGKRFHYLHPHPPTSDRRTKKGRGLQTLHQLCYDNVTFD